jgi:hypothetical protein
MYSNTVNMSNGTVCTHRTPATGNHIISGLAIREGNEAVAQ